MIPKSPRTLIKIGVTGVTRVRAFVGAVLRCHTIVFLGVAGGVKPDSVTSVTSANFSDVTAKAASLLGCTFVTFVTSQYINVRGDLRFPVRRGDHES